MIASSALSMGFRLETIAASSCVDVSAILKFIVYVIVLPLVSIRLVDAEVFGPQRPLQELVAKLRSYQALRLWDSLVCEAVLGIRMKTFLERCDDPVRMGNRSWSHSLMGLRSLTPLINTL
jgi:hypothetical protein